MDDKDTMDSDRISEKDVEAATKEIVLMPPKSVEASSDPLDPLNWPMGLKVCQADDRNERKKQ